MNRGYVRLWRKVQDSAVFQNEGLLKVFIWCIVRANYQETWVSVRTGKGFTEVRLSPGSFIFGRHSAAKELKMPAGTVWKRMLKLEKLEILDIQRDTHYSIIHIINWPIYQAEVEKKDRQKDTQGTGKGHREELKEGKEYTAQSFDAFYQSYPVKKNKAAALKAWGKIKPGNGTLELILSAIERQKTWRDAATRRGEFVPQWPHPATWLNDRRWEDETEEVKATW